MKSKKRSSGKYANELAKLKELNAIKEVLKKSDIENAALTNTSKDSETVNDNVVDNMLDELNLNKNAHRDLEIIESLTAQNTKKNIINSIRSKNAKAELTAKQVANAKKQAPMKKASKAKPQKAQKSKGKKKR
ncbi:MAG: hypothetical protein ABR981_01440 [Candidatus Micrarchaeaceae archaeon]|jgi:hypothetical protein